MKAQAIQDILRSSGVALGCLGLRCRTRLTTAIHRQRLDVSLGGQIPRVLLKQHSWRSGEKRRAGARIANGRLLQAFKLPKKDRAVVKVKVPVLWT